MNIFLVGAASLDVKQEIEECMPEARIMLLLSGLQKTSPPVSERLREMGDDGRTCLGFDICPTETRCRCDS